MVNFISLQLATIIGQEAAQEVNLVVGVKKQVQKLTSNLQAIQDVLEDAEKKQVKEAAVRRWLDKLKQASYDIDDVLDEWNAAILKLKIEEEAGLARDSFILAQKVCSFIPSPCFYLSQIVHRHDIALKTGDLNEKLEMISIEKERYHLNSTRSSEEPERLITTSFVDASEVFGRDHDENALVHELLEDYMPKEIGKLTILRTLDELKVTKPDYTDGCKLGDLKDLNHLRGELSITSLQYVSNVREAEVACLNHEKHLRSLTLCFDEVKMRLADSDVINDGIRTFQKHLLNALEPHQDLEHLEISVYSGTGLFPNWILSLTKLKLLSLNECVGLEFLGLKDLEGRQKQKSEGESSKSSLVLFPKLKNLYFRRIENWIVWEGLPTDGGIAVMPSLRSLRISGCPELNALPEFLHVAPLQELSIHNCPTLTQRYQRETGEDWPKIFHIPKVKILNIGWKFH
ncbi:hypothetical protein L6164_000786 [Bauhinia variegata]|uniref:Uncharacterized protein n=1 Tax=Bauhinia variegata TaxID=167791 RepID=A0ACB9Q7Q1_BAUVA|nr:hypothetical protein L6164_000786 [Bauhinia variegata]